MQGIVSSVRRRSLALRLAGYVSLAAVLLALVASGTLIYLDYRSVVRHVEITLPSQLQPLRSAAAQAAYQFDRGLALAVTEGALQNPGVVRALVLDDYGAVLADNQLFPVGERSRAISDALFGLPRDLTIPLRHDGVGGQEIGSLVVTVDPMEIAGEFIEREILLTLYGFSNVFAISLVLYAIAYLVVARPLARVAGELTAAEGAARATARLPQFEWKGTDELGRLVQAVDTLCRVIERAVGNLRMRDRALGAITQGIAIADASQPGYPIVHVNEAFERITGYAAADLLGRSCKALQGRDTDAETLAIMRRTLANGQPFLGELLNYRKDGTAFWNLLSISPVHEDGGRLAHYIAVLTDVTERRQLETQLRHAQKMEAVGQLTGGIAHDFNNLLTVILGNAEILGERLQDRDGARMAGMIQEMALRGADLTQRLLAFARRQALQPKRIDVNSLVNETAPVLRRAVGEAITVEMILQPELWPALADASQLQTALLNLAINARDAMPQGGQLTVETANATFVGEGSIGQTGIEPIAPGGYVMISVTDDGTGMPGDVLRRAFEPFFTTKEVGQGSGLGLSMVYGFVNQSGGYVRIYSEIGRGTTVKMFFPRAVVVDAPSLPGPDSDEMPAGSGEPILVVEDDEQVRAHVEGMLQDLDYRVITARNGVEALSLLAGEAEIALLFSDVVMPGGIDGVELADRARQIRPQLKVLLTSGYPESALRSRSPTGRLPDLLMKPYRRSDLAGGIRAVLDRG
jgi:PAS domain S-box-containing protein